MKYKVKTPDGEVGFESLNDIAAALRQSLVDLDDELIEVGTNGPPRKVGDVKVLAEGIRSERHAKSFKPPLLTMMIVILSGVAIILLAEQKYFWAGGVAILVTALLSRATYSAFQRRR